MTISHATPTRANSIQTGAEQLVETKFEALVGKRIGLITNQTGLVAGRHLVDFLSENNTVNLTAIFAPEHGFRGFVEAGAKVKSDSDPKTGVPIFSLYGKTRKPTQAMLQNVDVLIFDIQDIGVRYYTYISTMGLAMQAAAKAGVPFIVLDRPNPLGGTYVSGFTLRKSLKSFVGQYPIPVVHGMTVGELALMIAGERWLTGLEKIDLHVIKVKGWKREMLWSDLNAPWVPTSPNIPTFAAALAYPGIGFVGETDTNEGRGTPTPFLRFGAPWANGTALARQLNAKNRPGVIFQPSTFTPRSIKGVAATPTFKNTKLRGVRLDITDGHAFEPLETGVYVLDALHTLARQKKRKRFFRNLPMFNLLAGTKRFHRMLESGKSAEQIIESWRDDVREFRAKRKPYLLYR